MISRFAGRAGSNEFEKRLSARTYNMAVSEEKRDILLDDLLRARLEGAFVSPCGTEGALWEGFPEWPEEYPDDVLLDVGEETGE
jgi:hypothetical protein